MGLDIGDMSSTFTNYVTSNAQNNKTDALTNQVKTSDYSKATDDELMDACKSFEAYFLEQVFKEMVDTIPKSEDSSNSQLVDYFTDNAITDLAEQSTETQGIGLAQSLYEQMKRNYDI